MKPKVTVVMPSFNVAPYIGNCLKSVLNQTLKDIEIIVVDAYSTDGTREIINEYMKKDDRITLVDDVKRSTGYSKNVAIDMAQAPYYAIVEPDDYVELDMLEKMYNIAEETEVDFVKANFSSFIGSGDNRYDFPKTVSLDFTDYGRVLDPRKDINCYKWIMYEWLGLYRVDFLRKHNIRHNETPGAAFQDTGFWFLTLAYANSVYLMKDSFYHYRSDNPNASVKDTKKTLAIAKEYEYIHDCINDGDLDWNQLKSQFCRGVYYDNYMVLKRIDYELMPTVVDKMREMLTEVFDDEIEKRFFYEKEWERVNILLNSAEEYLKEEHLINEDIAKREQALLKAVDGRESIFVYGAGSYGANVQFFLDERGYQIKAYIDSNKMKHGLLLNGKEIWSLEKAKNNLDNPLYIVANREYSKEIYETLLNDGISTKDIYVCDIVKCVRLLI